MIQRNLSGRNRHPVSAGMNFLPGIPCFQITLPLLQKAATNGQGGFDYLRMEPLPGFQGAFCTTRKGCGYCKKTY
jgi:hypothetical protein